MGRQALEGLKVLDLSWVIAGPIVSLYLAHHGATVVRVESMKRPDPVRKTQPCKDNIPGVNRCVDFDAWNSNKLSMSLNLAHPKGREIAKRLVAWADVVGENFAPGVTERMGLTYADLKKVKPDIIMYSSSNLGQTGPEARQPGYGVMLAAYSGFTHLTGWPDRVSSQPHGAYNDFVAPRLLVSALLAAIEYRRRTGKGQHLDVSQLEAGIQFLLPVVLDYTVNGRIQTRQGNRSPCAAPHNAYRCQGDERWCAISIFTDGEWQGLRRVMGEPAWAQDARFTTFLGRKNNEDELDRRLSEWASAFTAEESMARLQAAGVPAGVVKNAADIQQDPQLTHRRYFTEVAHPEIGLHYYEGITGSIMSRTPAEIRTPSPLLGQHTDYVAREILHMTEQEVVELREEGVLE